MDVAAVENHRTLNSNPVRARGRTRDKLALPRLSKLEFGNGAPSTRATQDLWVGRFNAFREFTLKKALTDPFSGDDILRFFDSIISKIRPTNRGKRGPGVEWLTSAFKILSAYGIFTYPKSSGYELTNRDGLRLHTFLDDAVKDGRLTKGLWHRSVWLNYMTLTRIGRSWLQYHHTNGSLNWDITLSRWLSVVLVASLGCRVGDAARSALWTGDQYMLYEHIDLLLDDRNEPRLENLRARISIEYQKGFKDTRNERLECFVSPIDDPCHPYMCLITLLLIHSLRHGLVRGSNITDVLRHASGAPDGKVECLYPHRPILTAFRSDEKAQKNFCALDARASSSQVADSIKKMGITANILTRVHIHATRLGHAQDVAHQPHAVDGSGFVTDTGSFNRGATEAYVGAPTREFWNERATNRYESRWAPKFSDQSAEELIKGRVSDEEIRKWQQQNEPLLDDRNSQKARQRAMYNIRQDRHQIFLETAKPSTSSRHKAEVPVGVMAEKSASQVNVLANKVTSVGEPSEQSPPEDPHSNVLQIDPRLLLDDDDDDILDTMHVDEAKAATLQSCVLLQDQGQTEHDFDNIEALAAEELLLQAQDFDPVTSSSITNVYSFISTYTKINILKKTSFAQHWGPYHKGSVSFEQSIRPYCVTGNTRDDPTPLLYHCQATPGCAYESARKQPVVGHEKICNVDSVAKAAAARDHPCPCQGCSSSFRTVKELQWHLDDMHHFDPKPCPHGCEAGKLYTSASTYRRHLSNKHSGRWPTSCRFPAGTETKLYDNPGTLRIHLIHHHGLDTTEKRKPYLPETAARYKTWKPTPCPIDACPDQRTFSEKRYLRLHLISKEGYGMD
ncbi:MAG: hypothetical protein M1816_000335 [Peltula sp. TS41687]|nr:MAG: hypothetical protein M1816_000335 [Peltula sp. TS41687]